MRYMMLIHHDDEALAKAPPSLWGDYAAFNAALEKAGGSAGERLNPAGTARRVSLKAGKREVLDGPYAETKEQFAGYFMVDAATPEEAADWAARCPSSAYGTIEIRGITPQGS